jgi:hypothetical protein
MAFSFRGAVASRALCIQLFVDRKLGRWDHTVVFLVKEKEGAGVFGMFGK